MQNFALLQPRTSPPRQNCQMLQKFPNSNFSKLASMQPTPAPRLRGRIVLSPKSKKHFASVLVCHDETRKDRFRIHEIVDFFRIITDHVWWLDASPDRSRQPPSRGPRSSAPRRRRSVRFPAKWRMKNGLNFPPNFERLVLGCIDANFANKYSLESSWRDLQDVHTFAPLSS